ncbi:MAG TPA: hypothetical protein VMT99_00015 [Candidatus Paceibacterota bacterium]|nr:hypothetical protein [Candidatus Paceibacterota bacterium]
MIYEYVAEFRIAPERGLPPNAKTYNFEVDVDNVPVKADDIAREKVRTYLAEYAKEHPDSLCVMTVVYRLHQDRRNDPQVVWKDERQRW